MTDNMPIVRLGTWLDKTPGIDIGETNLFLMVEYRGPQWQRYRVRDFHEILDPRTAWVNLKRPGDLRTSQRAKPIRDVLKAEYPEKANQVLEMVIGCIQDNEETWLPREEEEQTDKQQEESSLDPEIEQEAKQILESPNVLETLKSHLDNLLIGEDDNKKLEFVLLLSGVAKDPSLKQMILLKAESGAGKSHLMRLTDAFKTKNVGRFTAHALDYTNLENYQILKLKELGDMDQEFQGVSTVKFLSSDDMGYIVEASVRDESGHFTTQQYRVPPITVITSTTRVALDSQFERRAWILNPDESEEQTRRIAEWKAKHEHEKDLVGLGLLKETSYDHSMQVLRAIIQKLEPLNVILPFPKSITNLIGSSKLRLRGDYDKFFSLVRLHTFLHQKTLPISVNPKGEKSVWATPSKAFEILKVAEQPYQTMASGLEKRTRELVEVLGDLDVTIKGETIGLEKRGEMATRLGKSEDTIYKYFKEWQKAGYMTSEKTKGRGNPVQFKLLFDLNTIREKTLVTFGISENPKIDSLEFQKEAEAFLSSFSDSISWGKGYTFQSVLDMLKIEKKEDRSPLETESERRDLEDSASIHEKEQATVGLGETPKIEPSISEKKQRKANLFNHKDSLTTQETKVLLRSKWTQGYEQDFDELVMKTRGCTKEEAEQLREQWLDQGILAYDPDGWLTWL